MENGDAPRIPGQVDSEAVRTQAAVGTFGSAVSLGTDSTSAVSRVTSEEKQKILRERAWKLAQKAGDDRTAEESVEVIEFMLAHERYAIEVRYVREVYPLKDLTPVPCAPSLVLGILNVRGQVISVTDVREFFDLPKKEITDLLRVLVVDNHSMELGIVADEVLGQRRIELGDIHSGMIGTGKLRGDFVRGVTKDRLIVLDADKLLSDKAVIVHQEVDE
jgi:purine-binding chemotaxis protein CheW